MGSPLPSDPAALRATLDSLSISELELLRWKLKWKSIARRKQYPFNKRLPDGGDWDFYGVMSGRGWGKTLTAANWLGLSAAQDPESYNFVVAPTHDDLIKVCFYGPTGLHAVIPRRLIRVSTKSPPVIELRNGAQIFGFSADTPERLRGPQCLTGDTLIAMADGSSKEISQIEKGEYVLTRRGPRLVKEAWCSQRNASLWRLTTEHGAIVCGTMGHLVYSKARGFTPLCQLRSSDPLQSYSTAGSIGGSQEVISSGSIESVHAQRVRESVDTSTGMSTNFITGGYRRGIWFTIKTIIARITLRIISRLSPEVGMDLTTTPDKSYHENRYEWLEEDSSNDGRINRRLYPDVSSAGGDSKLDQWPSPGPSAPGRVSNVGEDRVRTVEKLETYADVYDLEIEDEHEFFANGILVHNCHRMWGDEIASWRYPDAAWDNLIFGLRLGMHPQVFWTGTPKPKPFIRQLVKLPRSIVVTGSTYENRENIPQTLFDNVAKYEGTKIGRQELYGEIIDPEEAGFVKRSDWRLWPARKPLPKFRFILMSYDTALTEKTWHKKDQTGDPTACSVWGLFDYEGLENVMLLDAWEDHLGFPQLIRRVKAERDFTYGDADEPVLRPIVAEGHRPKHTGRSPDVLLIEDKGSGISLRQQLAVENIFAEAYNPGDLDKLSRLHACSPMFPARRVWAVESDQRQGEPRSWAEPLISQVCTYVGEGSLIHDDLLDTTTQALLYIMHKFRLKFTTRVDPTDATTRALESLKRKERKPIYG